MIPVRIKFRHNDKVIETMLLEVRPDLGPEIRQQHAPDCEAGTFAVLDVDVSEYGDTLAERLGLDEDDIDRLSRWRDAAKMKPDERVDERMTAKELGAILDRIARRLSRGTERDVHRIVVEVEPTP